MAVKVAPRGPTSNPRSLPVAATCTVSSSTSLKVTSASRPNSSTNPARKPLAASPCCSSVSDSSTLTSLSSGGSLPRACFDCSPPPRPRDPRRRRFEPTDDPEPLALDPEPSPPPAGIPALDVGSPPLAVEPLAPGPLALAIFCSLADRDEAPDRSLRPPFPPLLLFEDPPERPRSSRRRSDLGRRPRLGGGTTGRTRACTRASPRRRPNRPALGSLSTTNSASSSATPSRSRTVSLASGRDLPLASTHSTRYRAFLSRLVFDRGCSLGLPPLSAAGADPLPFEPFALVLL